MTMGKKVGIAVICILIVLIAIGGTLFFLLMKDDSKKIYQEDANTDLIAKAAAAAGLGKEAEINQKELNGFLSYLFQQQEQKDTQITNLYFTIGEGQGDAGVYACCRFHGLEIGITARVDLSFDQETKIITIRIDKMKAGRLPVSPRWGLSLVKASLPSGISIKDNQILVDTKQMEWHMGELETLLEIQDVRVENGKLYLSTNGMVDAIDEYLKQQIGENRWGDLLNRLGGTVKDYLSDWLQ